MGQFRERMIEEIEVRGLSIITKDAYLWTMEKFVRFGQRPPNQLGITDIKKYQLYFLREEKLSPRSINKQLSAIVFFIVMYLKNTGTRRCSLG
ncbi:MAG: site-specific integrase [Pseudomonadota bacterium]